MRIFIVLALVFASFPSANAGVISSLQRVDPGIAPILHRGEDIFTFFPGTPVWRDYTFFFDATPDYLRRTDHVLTSYATDKDDPDFQLRLTLAGPAQVYLVIDDRVPNVAAQMPWIASSGFADTGDNVLIRVSNDMILTTASIYSGRFPAGDLLLYAQNGLGVESGMYTIGAAAVPEPGSLLPMFIALAGLFILRPRFLACFSNRS